MDDLVQSEAAVELRRIGSGASAGAAKLPLLTPSIGKPMLATESSNEYTHPQIPDNPTSDGTGWTVEPPAYASPFN